MLDSLRNMHFMSVGFRGMRIFVFSLWIGRQVQTDGEGANVPVPGVGSFFFLCLLSVLFSRLHVFLPRFSECHSKKNVKKMKAVGHERVSENFENKFKWGLSTAKMLLLWSPSLPTVPLCAVHHLLGAAADLASVALRRSHYFALHIQSQSGQLQCITVLYTHTQTYTQWCPGSEPTS